MRLLLRTACCSLTLLCPAAFAQLFSYGVKAGVPLTDALADVTSNQVDLVQRVFSNSKNYVVGATVELHLPLGLSAEADALYHPITLTTENQLVSSSTTSSTNHASWEFPILLKYRFPLPLVKPYLEAGPNFRTIGGSPLANLSNSGFTLGGGVELRVSRFRFGPEIRYTRWGSDAQPPAGQTFVAQSNLNQAEFLVGFSF